MLLLLGGGGLLYSSVGDGVGGAFCSNGVSGYHGNCTFGSLV